jgi:5-methylcytosine-specific restriction endonuclease McrA
MKQELKQVHEQLLILVSKERKILSAVLSHLQIISDKHWYLDLGRKNLLEYCIKDLGYSESAAIRRIKALKLARQLPEVKSAIEAGKINLTQVAAAQSLFERRGQENRAALAPEFKIKLLDKIVGKSSMESENIIRHELDLPKKSRQVRIEVGEETFSSWVKFKGSMIHKNWSDEKLLAYLLVLAEEKRLEKFTGAQALRHPHCVSKNPRPSKNQRSVIASVKRAVYAQSEGFCQYPGCQSTYALEIDHCRPIALNGSSTLENLQVLCRAHNQRRR